MVVVKTKRYSDMVRRVVAAARLLQSTTQAGVKLVRTHAKCTYTHAQWPHAHTVATHTYTHTHTHTASVANTQLLDSHFFSFAVASVMKVVLPYVKGLQRYCSRPATQHHTVVSLRGGELRPRLRSVIAVAVVEDTKPHQCSNGLLQQTLHSRPRRCR